MKYTTKKTILVILNAIGLIAFMFSICFLYSNANFKVGIVNLNTEVYEDSPAFMEQFSEDTQSVFDYIENREVFETDGKFDETKPIFSLSEGPGEDVMYTVKDIVTAARRRGYYIDENYQVLNAPNIITGNDESSYSVSWSSYDEEREINEPADLYVTIDELLQEVLGRLSRYYKAYDRLVAGPTNFSYRVEYNNQVFTNNGALSDMNVHQYGRYAICSENDMQIENNLINVPTMLGNLLESSSYNGPGITHKAVYVTVDTNYPVNDVYKEQATSYANERELYFRELLIATAAAVLMFATLVALVIIEVHNRADYERVSLFKGYKKTIEGRVFACALAIIVLLYLNEKVFKRLLHMYLPFDSWEFAERVVGYGCIYSCVAITAFSILKSFLAGNVWQCSLTRRLFDRLDKYIDENSFSKRSTLVLTAVIIGEAVISAVIVVMFFMEKTLVGRFLAIAVLLLFIAANLIFAAWELKKTQQYDKITDAVAQIAKGKTSYQLNEDEFDGKEKVVARNLNSLGSGLDKAINERVKSERMKADLITNVSHDIKTPLTSIINYVDLIKRENPSDPKIRSYLEVLDQKSQHLKHLTEDLVEASKVSSGNVNLEMIELDFVELVQQANGEFEEKFADKGLTIVSNFPLDADGGVAPLVIKADGASLWRVLENLYNNAYKYALENSRVYVDMRRIEDDGRAEFVMKNISARPLNISADELTERFVRGDVSRTTEGSGLGLSIAGSLTRLQGGTFQLQIDGDLFKAIVRM